MYDIVLYTIGVRRLFFAGDAIIFKNNPIFNSFQKKHKSRLKK